MSTVIDEQLHTTTDTGIPEHYLRAYFGPQANYYISKYRQYREGDRYTFNISCFLAGVFWLLYRKMFIHFVVVVAAMFASGVLEEALPMLFDVDYEVMQGFSMVMNIAFAIAFGALGNYFYLKKSESTILEVIGSISDEQQKLYTLTRKGGISYSPFYLLIAIILFFFIIGVRAQ